MLFINSCVRKNSRTKKLADAVIAKATSSDASASQPVTEIKLWEQDFPVVDEAFLAKRDSLIYAGQFDDPMFDETKEFYYDTRTSERFCRKFSDWDELIHDVCCFVDKQMTFQNEAACRFQFSTNLTEDEFIDITTRIKERE